LRIRKWIGLSNMDLRFIDSPMLLYDGFNRFLSKQVLVMRTFYENISNICVLNLSFGDLDLGSTLILKASDCLTTLTND
jgi:hypothetical protein